MSPSFKLNKLAKYLANDIVSKSLNHNCTDLVYLFCHTISCKGFHEKVFGLHK